MYISMDETIVTFRGNKLEAIMEYMSYLVAHNDEIFELKIAYDDLSESIKFKVNGATWTPPYTGDTQWKR